MKKIKSINDSLRINKNPMKSRPLSIVYGYLYWLSTLKRILQYSITKKPYFFPSMFQIQTVNYCNGSCVMCPLSSKKKEKPEFMSDELFEKIIEEIIKEHPPFISIFLYLQNEPLLDKDIFKKISLINDLSNGKILTGLITNGSLLTSEKIQELKESGLTQIKISIDAFTEETYKKIRAGLDFKTVLENTNNLVNSNCKTKVYTGFVIQKENIKELNKFKKYWSEKGVTVDIHFVNNRAGNLSNFKNVNLKTEKIPSFKGLAENILKSNYRCCPHVLSNFNILYNGDVITCCNDYNKELILGNVNESSIKKIWNGDNFQKLRATLYDDYRKVTICRRCNFWYKADE